MNVSHGREGVEQISPWWRGIGYSQSPGQQAEPRQRAAVFKGSPPPGNCFLQPDPTCLKVAQLPSTAPTVTLQIMTLQGTSHIQITTLLQGWEGGNEIIDYSALGRTFLLL